MYKSLLVCLCFSCVGGIDTKIDNPAAWFEQPERACAPELNKTNEVVRNLTVPCQLIPLDHPLWKDEVPIRYRTVQLIGCSPQESYMEFFRAQNRSVETELILSSLPNQLPYRAFTCLPRTLKKLVLSAASFLVLEPGALVGVRVDSLELNRVQVDRLPPAFQELKLSHRGSWLPLGALDVPSLMIEETNFTSLAASHAPRLQRLQVSAPMVELPDAPALATLVLYQLGAELPSDLLRNVKHITTFIAERGSFTTLPETFFSHCLQLETIRLKDNQLTSLPMERGGLFSGLTKLRTLNLEGNWLAAQELRSVSFAALRVLELSRNPLGDFCPKGESLLKPLKHLTRLGLSETRLTQICHDWLQNMKQLQYLDLTSNFIRTLSCADLRVQRDLPAGSPAPEIKLKDNPIASIYCSWLDHEAAVSGRPPAQKVQMTASPLLCSCGTYWLSRVLREQSATVNFSPAPESACPSLGHRCRLRMECPPGVELRCEKIRSTDDGDHFYVNGDPFIVRFDDGNFFNLTCTPKNMLEDAALPAFPRRVHFNTVILRGCSPPEKIVKYIAEAVVLLNATIGENLYLFDLPSTARFTSLSLNALASLKLLHLESAKDLEIPRGVLTEVNPISTLHLVGVHFEELPTYLTHLNLTDTGFRQLQPGIQALELTIIEKNLTTLPGSSWRLERLSVTAPVRALPTARALRVLELTGAEPIAGFLSGYPELHTLRLRRLALQQLPNKFLDGATQLRHFELTRSNFTTLPADLFSFSPNLETIDLSNNRLEVLPRYLFANLLKVTTLNLENNTLGWVHRQDFKDALPALREFKYEGN